MGERGDLKRKEEEAKVEIRDLRDSIEEMKIKIETFAAEKRNAMTEYRIQEMAHKKFITDKREEAKMKRREEKEAAEAQKMKEWEEIKANEEPFEKERFLVSTLILYCQKLDPLYGSEDTIDNCKNGSSSINNAIPDKCVVYRKTDENDVFFPGVKKGTSGKKSAKKQKARNLKHNPETYVQFASLLLKPPTTSKDVPMVIDKLKEKIARLLNEPSPLVDFLNDDLILSGNLDDQPKKNKCNGKEKSKNDCNFNIDQFPSLPQPRNGSLLE